MDFDNEDLNKENDSLENSYYDSDYNVEDDLNRLDNPYYDKSYNVEKDLDRLKNDSYENDNELLNENKPEEGNPALGRSNVNEEIKDTKAVGKKNGIGALLDKHPWIILVFIAGFLFLIAVLVFQLDFDLFGVGNPKPKYFAPPSCGKVYLTWENPSYTEARQKVEKDYTPITDASLIDLEEEDQYGVRYTYKEYEYDEYISGIVWTDNYNAKDVDNDVVYQAMVIAARSRLIAELPDNCVVLKNYNEQAQSFTELNGSEEKYSEIMQAVSASKGLIIGRKGQIIPALYEPFSYIKKRRDGEDSYNSQYFYHMAHENEEKQQVILADWVDELEKKKGTKITHKVSEIKKLTSLSLYGAKYLLELEDSQYDLYRILETYYGRDIEYYTIDTSAISGGNLIAIGGSDCMWWPIGSSETYEENGILYANGTPSSVRITSNFGNRGGVSGVANASSNHQAIDIGGGLEGGTNINIIAAADGVINKTFTGCVQGNQSCGGGLGNYIYIDHGNGLVTRYGHLYSLSVNNGDTVKQGQVIGKMGSTGASSGVHLDFQVIDNGNKVNPLNYVSANDSRAVNCGLTPPSVTLTPGSGDGKESICVAFLNAGYTPAQTAGVMVNAYDESRFDPSAFNPSGGGIGAYGLFQWRSGRQSSLKTLKNYNTAEVQAAFALSELNSSESNAKKHLLSSSNAGISAYNFCKYFERPGSDSYCTGRQNNALVNEYYTYASNGCK